MDGIVNKPEGFEEYFRPPNNNVAPHEIEGIRNAYRAGLMKAAEIVSNTKPRKVVYYSIAKTIRKAAGDD